MARSGGVEPPSSDLESEAHRHEYQDRIERLKLDVRRHELNLYI